jgi:hypothetical protein
MPAGTQSTPKGVKPVSQESADRISLADFVTGLSPIVGAQRAQEIVSSTISGLGLPKKPKYSIDEVRAITNELRKAGGLISMVAGALTAQLILGGRPAGQSTSTP